MSRARNSSGDERVRPDRWEVGGEFERHDAPPGSRLPWPEPHRMYGLATHAVMVLWDTLPAIARRTLHVPEYFCPEVVTAWRRHGIEIREYSDDPRLVEPVWSTLVPREGDVVLAVNFFGVRSGEHWTHWRRRHPDVLLVEDHSHDPGSPWARHSGADYAFASLRKTLPVSDGAILWSPGGAALPASPPQAGSIGSELKWAAMKSKQEYLAGADVDKGSFRTMQIEGERALLSSDRSSITTRSSRLVGRGLPEAWRARRRQNVRLLIELIGGAASMRPLFTAWPRGHCPFNVVLLFDTEARRDACRAHLIGSGIYPPVHWAQPATSSRRARELASVILTIPADQRYDTSDMRRVAAVLRSFDDKPASQPSYSRSRGAR